MESSLYFKGQSKKSPLMHNEWHIETAALNMLPNACQTSQLIVTYFGKF